MVCRFLTVGRVGVRGQSKDGHGSGAAGASRITDQGDALGFQSVVVDPRDDFQFSSGWVITLAKVDFLAARQSGRRQRETSGEDSARFCTEGDMIGGAESCRRGCSIAIFRANGDEH